ncbi:nucleoside-diphosphate sugar epimerase [Opitutaceae bacterium TAV5]|nr:nucleoside-diphosphate sugar epimerase [Opitutaceae bacterium TAV5]
MNILVTGGSGKIGKVIVRHLLETGHAVRSLDRSYVPVAGAQVLVVDMRQPEAIYAAMEGVDAVVHFGNHSNLGRALPQVVLGENLTINANVCQAAVEIGIERMIFASSVQAMAGWPGPEFGDLPMPPHALPVDGDTPAYPGNCYGLSKALTEDMLRYYTRVHDLSAVALRLPIVIHGRPKRWREFLTMEDGGRRKEWGGWIWTEDVARLVSAILASDLPGFRVYHPSGPLPAGTAGAEEIASTYYPDAPRREPGKPLSCLIDVSRITDETGWKPTPLEDLPERDWTMFGKNQGPGSSRPSRRVG